MKMKKKKHNDSFINKTIDQISSKKNGQLENKWLILRKNVFDWPFPTFVLRHVND